MKYYTFENTDASDDAFYNLFNKTLVNYNRIQKGVHIVTEEQKGRLHAVSNFLHGTPFYVEELMVLNNIINPHTINTGDLIFYCYNITHYDLLHQSYIEDTSDIKDEILNKNKNKSTQKDPNRIGYAPTIKPDNIKQLNIDYSNKQIKINNKLS